MGRATARPADLRRKCADSTDWRTSWERDACIIELDGTCTSPARLGPYAMAVLRQQLGAQGQHCLRDHIPAQPAAVDVRGRIVRGPFRFDVRGRRAVGHEPVRERQRLAGCQRNGQNRRQ